MINPTVSVKPWWYLTKPVKVRAIQWTGENLAEVRAFLGGAMPYPKPDADNHIWFEGGRELVSCGPGNWMIEEAPGRYVWCHDDEFTQKHYPAPGTPEGELS